MKRPQHSRGLSLVELMVGVAIGLFITAAAAMLVSTQLASNRQLLVETQVQQDLRATAELVSRDLRRASYAANAETFASLPDSSLPPAQSAYGNITIRAGEADCSDVAGTNVGSYVEYRYARGLDPVYSLQLAGHVIQRRVGSGGWQALTDANVLSVTSFCVADQPAATNVKEPLACPNLCANGTTSCWPTVAVRELRIVIKGRSVIGATSNDAAFARKVESSIRVRNDVVTFNTDSPGQVCP